MSKTQHLTCIFKLRNPSAWKRELLDFTLTEYTNGYKWLLDLAADKADELRERGSERIDKETGEVRIATYTAARIAPHLPPASAVPFHLDSALKSNLLRDVAGNLASYFELKQSDDRTSWPASRDTRPEAYPEAIERLVTAGCDEAEERYWAEKMQILRRGQYMPVFYNRSRDALILVDLNNPRRLFAALKTVPSSHPLACKFVARDNNLVDINTGDVLQTRGRNLLVVPIEYGKEDWQRDEFINPTINGDASVKSSRLVKRGDDYLLHVSFAFNCPPVPKLTDVKRWIGIDRGVLFTVAYGIVDQSGRIVGMSHFDDGLRDMRIDIGKRVQQKLKMGQRVSLKDYKQQALDAVLHQIVNRILDIAEEHDAGLALESLDIRINGRFYRSNWKKLYRIFEYKCNLRGILMREVFAAYSSQICIYCGNVNKNRRRGQPFECPRCYAVYHSDEGAGVNIARRVFYRKSEWEKKGGYLAFHRSFANSGDFGTETDLLIGSPARQLSLAFDGS